MWPSKISGFVLFTDLFRLREHGLTMPSYVNSTHMKVVIKVLTAQFRQSKIITADFDHMDIKRANGYHMRAK